MIINKINTISNQNFNAIIESNLRAEIDNKRKTLERLPNRKRSVNVSKFNSYIKEIEDTLPQLKIEIDKNNPNEYLLKYKLLTGYFPMKQKIFRNKDEKSYNYNSLRNGLKLLDKFFTEIATKEFTHEEKERLKEFEANVLNLKHR